MLTTFTRLKKSIAIVLLLLGAVEVFYGVIFGRGRIYAYEASFSQDMGFSPEKSRTFLHYIDAFKDQWHIVAWFGVLTIAAAVLLLLPDKKRV
jgi:uncharacterized membrane protein HdeD (DUF308 family)